MMKQWVIDNPDSLIAQQQQQAGAQTIGLVVGIVFTALLFVYPLFCIFWFGAGGKRPEVGKPEVL